MSTDWKEQFNAILPKLGHRNWILIADQAYPLQCKNGIETIATGEDHLEVARYVLGAVNDAKHVQSNTYLDSEIKYVSESDAPGIEAVRNELIRLGHQSADFSYKGHETLIHDLDNAGKAFNILVLKTTLTIPYTSVFLELGCGYWNDEKEAKLRRAIAEANNL